MCGGLIDRDIVWGRLTATWLVAAIVSESSSSIILTVILVILGIIVIIDIFVNHFVFILVILGIIVITIVISSPKYSPLPVSIIINSVLHG